MEMKKIESDYTETTAKRLKDILERLGVAFDEFQKIRTMVVEDEIDREHQEFLFNLEFDTMESLIHDFRYNTAILGCCAKDDPVALDKVYRDENDRFTCNERELGMETSFTEMCKMPDLCEITDRVKNVIKFAKQEVLRLDQKNVTPECILLGLLLECASDDSNIVAKVLNKYSVDVEQVRNEIERIILYRTGIEMFGRLRLTPSAERVFANAASEAESQPFDVEHILLGILQDLGGVVHPVLAKFGLYLDNVRQDIKSFSS